MSTTIAVVLFLITWALSTVGLIALGFPFILALIVALVLTFCGVYVIDLTDAGSWF